MARPALGATGVSTSTPAPPSAEAVLAALCVLRPPEAGVSATLRRRMPAFSPEEAVRTLTQAHAPGDRNLRPPPDASPVSRFLARQRRRAADTATVTTPTAPFGALRLGTMTDAPNESSRPDEGAVAPADLPPGDLAAAAARLARWREDLEVAAAEHALALGVALAERLLQERLRCAPAIWGALLAEALGDIDGPLTLTIHPDDRVDVEFALGSRGPSVAIRTEPALARGDVVVASRFGRRDLRVRTRLAALLAGGFG
jgi:hypothetical protein